MHSKQRCINNYYMKYTHLNCKNMNVNILMNVICVRDMCVNVCVYVCVCACFYIHVCIYNSIIMYLCKYRPNISPVSVIQKVFMRTNAYTLPPPLRVLIENIITW